MPSHSDNGKVILSHTLAGCNGNFKLITHFIYPSNFFSFIPLQTMCLCNPKLSITKTLGEHLKRRHSAHNLCIIEVKILFFNKQKPTSKNVSLWKVSNVQQVDYNTTRGAYTNKVGCVRECKCSKSMTLGMEPRIMYPTHFQYTAHIVYSTHRTSTWEHKPLYSRVDL